MKTLVEKKGKFQRSESQKNLIDWLSDWRYEVTFYNGQTRTLQQNRRYRLILTILSSETGHTKEELHDVFKCMFLEPDETGRYTTITTKHNHCEYVDRVEQWAISRGIVIPNTGNDKHVQ